MVINLLSNTKTLRKDRWGCAKIRKMKKTRLRPQRVPKKTKHNKNKTWEFCEWRALCIEDRHFFARKYRAGIVPHK